MIRLEPDKDDAEAIMREIESETLDLQCEIGAYVKNRMVDYTPRRKGVAQASYRVGMGRVDGSAEKEGTTHAKPSPITAASLRPRAKMGRTIHVTNNLYRIGFLEDGSVRNKPSKMAARAVADVDGRFSG